MTATLPWNDAAFAAPVLADLDAAGRQRVAAAGRCLAVPAGVDVYNEGDAADYMFVVLSGHISLSCTPRGHDAPIVVRGAMVNDLFGEGALLHEPRRLRATAASATTVAQVPIAVFERVAGREGAGGHVDRLRRTLERRATADLMRTLAYLRELPQHDFDIALDSATRVDFSRGDTIYAAGDPAHAFYLVADGLVQLQSESQGQVNINAYLTRGDFFGDTEVLRQKPRKLAAVAMGACHLLRIPSATLRTLADRNPRLLEGLRRIRHALGEAQQQAVANAGDTTGHAFGDLYRLQMASSLLTIDQDLCVRCGHCTWTCEQTHGVARLVRRGDKLVTKLHVVGRESEARNLMLPNSCQHCRNPACMIDCPTGAIGRDPEGEVFINESLCTGCGNCAKACPWENIQMSPRPKGMPLAASLSGGLRITEVAVKCDLCRDFDAPACVGACPTEAILRLDPAADFAAVSQLLDKRGAKRVAGTTRQRIGAVWPWMLGLTLCVVAVRLHGQGIWAAAGLVGLPAGWASFLAMLGLAAYSLPKRVPRLWHRRRNKTAQPPSSPPPKLARSKVRPLYRLHVVLGLVAVVTVVVHTGLRVPGNFGGAAALGFGATALLGGLGAWVYRQLPSRLARIERRGMLPEDFAPEREALLDRFQRGLSGRSRVVKTITRDVLIPYVHDRMGSWKLLASGRSLKREQQTLSDTIKKKTKGRYEDKMGGLDDLLETVVEMRALPAQRVLTRALRWWLPVHMVGTGVTLMAVLLHVVSVMGGR